MGRRRSSPTRSLVYDRLREQIVSGQLPPGSLLVASKLATSLRASRTPVREALLRLAVEGLVVETPAGLVVKELTEEEIMEIYEVRIPLEGLAARLAAMNATPFHLAQLQALRDKFASASHSNTPSVENLVALNVEFHRAICQAARNAFLLEFMSRIYDAVSRFRTTTLRYPGRLQQAVGEHARLVEAILARDQAKAEEIARTHMERAKKIRIEMYRQAKASGFELTRADPGEGEPRRATRRRPRSRS